MTNRESAVSALASALTGKTVYSDLHILENRKPQKNIRLVLRKERESLAVLWILAFSATTQETRCRA